jgi:hypothetical protein
MGNEFSCEVSASNTGNRAWLPADNPLTRESDMALTCRVGSGVAANGFTVRAHTEKPTVHENRTFSDITIAPLGQDALAIPYDDLPEAAKLAVMQLLQTPREHQWGGQNVWDGSDLDRALNANAVEPMRVLAQFATGRPSASPSK